MGALTLADILRTLAERADEIEDLVVSYYASEPDGRHYYGLLATDMPSHVAKGLVLEAVDCIDATNLDPEVMDDAPQVVKVN